MQGGNGIRKSETARLGAAPGQGAVNLMVGWAFIATSAANAFLANQARAKSGWGLGRGRTALLPTFGGNMVKRALRRQRVLAQRRATGRLAPLLAVEPLEQHENQKSRIRERKMRGTQLATHSSRYAVTPQSQRVEAKVPTLRKS
jgi:hypothetical protein